MPATKPIVNDNGDSMVAYYEAFGDCSECEAQHSMYIVPKFNRKRCSVCGALQQSTVEDKERLVSEEYRDDIINTENDSN